MIRDIILLAVDIKDDTHKRALLFHQAGPEIYEIFKTLSEEREENDFNWTGKALTTYFKPEKNIIYQTYVFRQETQCPD